jgi:hypothetical protein
LQRTWITSRRCGNDIFRRADKRKQVQTRAKEPAFKAALELHCRDKWVFHPNIKETVDSYFEGEAIYAMELHPGMAVAVKAVPQEGHFEYSCQSAAASQPEGKLHVTPQAGQRVGVFSTEAITTPTASGKNNRKRRAHKHVVA